MPLQLGEHPVADSPRALGDESRVVAHEAVALIESRRVRLEDPIDGCAIDAEIDQGRAVVSYAVPARVDAAGGDDGDLDQAARHGASIAPCVQQAV